MAKFYAMEDSGEVYCDTEILECHDGLELECLRLAAEAYRIDEKRMKDRVS